MCITHQLSNAYLPFKILCELYTLPDDSFIALLSNSKPVGRHLEVSQVLEEVVLVSLLEDA